MKLLPLRVAGLIVVGWKSSERKRRGDEQQEGLNDGKYYPGRAKLATMPLLTGSVMWVNTMGIRPDSAENLQRILSPRRQGLTAV